MKCEFILYLTWYTKIFFIFYRNTKCADPIEDFDPFSLVLFQNVLQYPLEVESLWFFSHYGSHGNMNNIPLVLITGFFIYCRARLLYTV